MEFKTLKELHGKKAIKEEMKSWIEFLIDKYEIRNVLKSVKTFGFNMPSIETGTDSFTIQMKPITDKLNDQKRTALAFICILMFFNNIKIKDLRE